MIAGIAFVVLISLKQIQSVCDSEKLKKIESGWNGQPPEDLSRWYGGVWTTHLTSDKSTHEGDELVCWQEVVNVQESKGTEHEYYSNAPEDITPFKFSQVSRGVYEQRVTEDGRDTVMTAHVVYLNSDAGVQAVLMCSTDLEEDLDVHVNIKEDEKVKDPAKTNEAIDEALAAINKAGLRVPTKITTNCPSKDDKPNAKP